MCFVVKDYGTVLQQTFATVVELAELFGVVVRGRHIPVEVILEKDVLNFVVLDEGELLRIEGTYILGRQVFLEGALLADGEDELHKRLEDVVRSALFGLGPKQRLEVVVIFDVLKR